MSEPAPRAVLVGHCGPDARLLGIAVRRVEPDAEVVFVNGRDELAEYARPGHVWLVNRLPDGDFDGADGHAIIEAHGARAEGPVLLLISNLRDAQEAALARGARAGFGKSEVYSERAAASLRDAFQAARDAIAAPRSHGSSGSGREPS